MAFLWLLNQSDGTASISDIAAKSGLAIPLLAQAAAELEAAELLAPIEIGDTETPAICSKT